MSLSILEYYLEQNKNPKYVDEYQSTSGKKSGKTFWHINVNFRTLSSFLDVFGKFKLYDNKDRKTWEVYPENNEQRVKQMTVRMQQSKLFRKYKSFYGLTAKGAAFSDLVNKIKENRSLFSKNDIWILIYYFVLNSYFNLKPNYIIKQTNQVIQKLQDNGLNYSYIKQSFEILLLKEKGFAEEGDAARKTLFDLDAFWILSFYKDKDFISLYKNSTETEKKQLSDYVYKEYLKAKKNDSKDLIGWKFVSSGQYSPSSFYDDVKTLYVTYEMLMYANTDALILLDNICSICSRFTHINKPIIEKFVKEHFDVFEIICNEAIFSKNIDSVLNEELGLAEPKKRKILPSLEKIDDTTTKTEKVLRDTSDILKRMAKDRGDFKCELESLNSCIYFTSKENEKNFLEIHHLIPVEFSNEFENSIEVIENYIPLCPHCHRLLHLGIDRERKPALTYLYNQRIDGLKKKGLYVSLKEFLAFYDIDCSSK